MKKESTKKKLIGSRPGRCELNSNQTCGLNIYHYASSPLIKHEFLINLIPRATVTNLTFFFKKISDDIHLKPLLPCLEEKSDFSRNCRLFIATKDDIHSDIE